MKKKIFATLLAGALVASGAVGLSACNGNGISMAKGDKVTKEQWETAFENTSKINNYTLEGSADINATVKGTVTSSSSSSPKKTVEVKSKSNMSSSALYLYDEKGNASYSATSSTSKTSGSDDGEEGKSSSESIRKTYYALSEEKDSYKTYWRASYSFDESSSSSVEGKNYEKDEDYWDAYETSYFASNSIRYIFSETTFYETGDKETAKSKNITALYEKFEYSGGIYTATLYREIRLYSGVYELIECTVSVSFNSKENCVIGLGIKTEGKGTATEKDQYNLEYSYKGESIYSLTNINSTDVSKKANKDITKALDKAKAEKAEKEKA